MLLLGLGLPAKDRGLTRGKDSAVWNFPDDCEPRVRKIAAAVSSDE